MWELDGHFHSHSVILGVASKEFLLAFLLILLVQETSRTDVLEHAGVECFLEFFGGVSILESPAEMKLNDLL